MHLVEISVMEQRYQVVMAVIQDGWKVTEVADLLDSLSDHSESLGSSRTHWSTPV